MAKRILPFVKPAPPPKPLSLKVSLVITRGDKPLPTK
jgi:hypothetical protein